MKAFVGSQFEVIEVLSFKQNRIFMKTFFEFQFEVIKVDGFQTEAKSYEDIS